MTDSQSSIEVSTEENQTFEGAMAELEAIVKKLEENDVPLEEAIALFQKGMGLSKICHQKLQKVEKQMDQILHEDGTFQPFKLEEDELG
ncbi:exodeoxyribonuclease VII small subunit [Pullulanibacillus sp. KACC 23026]|uniref:exodeoxyribonuclease VII small subunit n=1 Tax=Pullulanibacillus sp. KACC 23026 TaxID=3028315 RepID=UPI0023B201A7|nr:exodeoxyribonuclease VII small subunit [Pullulanibacillus sp. KACC 23026]WEG14320.1 exodeoxyribonuclease VII small subunit [Pullulanibacillus sp. KACC 23026]